MNQPSPVARVLAALGPFIALLVVVVVLRVMVGPSFCAAHNICFILTQSAIVAIGACGMTLIIVSGGIDLSVGSSIALTGVIAALTLHAGWPPVLALLAAMASGALIGLINGSLIVGGTMAPFIVTLGMLSIARGSAKELAGQESVNITTTWLDKLMQPFPFASDPLWFQWLLVAPGVWLAALIAIGMSVMMSRGVFGRHVYAIGSNEAGARLCGIRVHPTKILIYVIAGGLVGLSGLLMMAKLHQGDPTTAAGTELDVIAAVVIGGASLMGGRGTILGTMIGAVLMGVLHNGIQQLGQPTSVQEIIIGIVIIVAVWIDQLRTAKTS
jgi:ribose transport system permease protein